jgi:hypothetical protein
MSEGSRKPRVAAKQNEQNPAKPSAEAAPSAQNTWASIAAAPPKPKGVLRVPEAVVEEARAKPSASKTQPNAQPKAHPKAQAKAQPQGKKSKEPISLADKIVWIEVSSLCCSLFAVCCSLCDADENLLLSDCEEKGKAEEETSRGSEASKTESESKSESEATQQIGWQANNQSCHWVSLCVCANLISLQKVKL